MDNQDTSGAWRIFHPISIFSEMREVGRIRSHFGAGSAGVGIPSPCTCRPAVFGGRSMTFAVSRFSFYGNGLHPFSEEVGQAGGKFASGDGVGEILQAKL